MEFEDGTTWHVRGDSESNLCTVFDGADRAIGWLEEAGKGLRQVVLPDGSRPPVSFENKLFSRQVRIGETCFRAVMMLEGRMRVFGDERIKLEHRDFHSEVRFYSAPDFLVAAVIVAYEVYARPVIKSGPAAA